jgi:hypothetical protein
MRNLVFRPILCEKTNFRFRLILHETSLDVDIPTITAYYSRMRAWSALAVVALLTSCGGHDNSPTQSASAKLPIGFLDAPKNEDAVRGMTTVSGWALSETGIRDVTIYVDRVFVGNAQLQVSRPDLARFSLFPEPDKGGFEYGWDSTTIPPGRHEIVAQARAKDGAVRDVGVAWVTTAQ